VLYYADIWRNGVESLMMSYQISNHHNLALEGPSTSAGDSGITDRPMNGKIVIINL
jgi:hypothetical protein